MYDEKLPASKCNTNPSVTTLGVDGVSPNELKFVPDNVLPPTIIPIYFF
jgi:hypothetical protein